MKKISKILSIFLVGIAFSSCLKDKNVEDQKYGLINLNANKIVGFTAAEVSNAIALENKDVIVEVPIHVAVENASSANQTVHLTIANDQTLRDEYNTAHGASVNVFPTNLYSLEGGLDVVIPAGSKDGSVKVKLNPSQLDASQTYGIGFTISGVPDGYVINKNLANVFAVFSVKNPYDGVYSQEAGSKVTRYTNPTTPANDALSGSTAGNPAVTLATVDATTVLITGLTWAGGTSGVAGIDNLRAKIDPTTNQVTMSSGGNATLKNIAGMDNKYDPATKTFTLNFDWNQTALKREMTLVLKYKSVRP